MKRLFFMILMMTMFSCQDGEESSARALQEENRQEIQAISEELKSLRQSIDEMDASLRTPDVSEEELRLRLKVKEKELIALRQKLTEARKQEQAALESLADFRKRFPSTKEEDPKNQEGR